jgi:hypothetical protein
MEEEKSCLTQLMLSMFQADEYLQLDEAQRMALILAAAFCPRKIFFQVIERM